jgi:ComF family protein
MPDTIYTETKDQNQEARFFPGLLVSKDRVQSWLAVGLDLLFPPRCAGCGRVDTIWCSRCQHDLDAIPLDTVVQVGTVLNAVAATGLHSGRLQQMLWSLKYENRPDLALPLGDRLLARLLTLGWTFDTIVPVPLHTTRMQERGYNQSQLLAERVAQHANQPCYPDAIHRQRQTQSQVGLNAQERQTNMNAAFIANPQIVADTTLLLIDDVYTTGATLGACAQAAFDAGARAVYGLTVTAARD